MQHYFRFCTAWGGGKYNLYNNYSISWCAWDPCPIPPPPKTISIVISPCRDLTLTQQLVDQTKLIDAECKQLVELAKEVQKHAVERTKNVRYYASESLPFLCPTGLMCSCTTLHALLTSYTCKLHCILILQDLSTLITRIVAFSHQLSHLASARLTSCTG